MNKRIEILLHVAVWTVLFMMPLTFLNRGNGINFTQYLMVSMSPLLVMAVFYANYLWLTPRYFVTGKHRYYWVINIAMIITLGILLHFWMSYTHDVFSGEHHTRRHAPDLLDIIFFIFRDIVNLAISAAVATTAALAKRWMKAEATLKDAEAARTVAELSNLRSQMNPHFLLNTLNNIYALTAFDTPKAQEAIQELSRMMRHILYDNQQPFVTMKEESEFLEDYIKLMKIRISESVSITFEKSIQNPQQAVAPMLFISLVENAFKHGISPTEPSFIRINISADDHSLVCDIQNSNHPKTASDRSGHGIGLQQVQRRLDLSYPGRYTWERGASADGKTYTSKITISL